MDSGVEPALRTLPLFVLLALSALIAWKERGSILGVNWLQYAFLGALALAAVLLSGAALRPSRTAIAAVAATAALGAWVAVTILWSPVPGLARDEALLT